MLFPEGPTESGRDCQNNWITLRSKGNGQKVEKRKDG